MTDAAFYEGENYAALAALVPPKRIPRSIIEFNSCHFCTSKTAVSGIFSHSLEKLIQQKADEVGQAVVVSLVELNYLDAFLPMS